MNSCVLPPHKNRFQLSNIKWCKYLEYFKFFLRFVLNGLCKTKHEYINIFNCNFMVFVCEVFVYLSFSPVVNTSKRFGIKEKEELHKFIFEFSLGWLSMWYLNHWLFKRGSIDRLFIIRMHIVTWNDIDETRIFGLAPSPWGPRLRIRTSERIILPLRIISIHVMRN